jgi:hypothetical protein
MLGALIVLGFLASIATALVALVVIGLRQVLRGLADDDEREAAEWAGYID